MSSQQSGRKSPTLVRASALADEDNDDIIPDAAFSDDRPTTYFRSLTQSSKQVNIPLRELEKDRHDRIRSNRGALRWLPMHSFSNDLVYAMWWFVWGSIFTTIIPIIPLVALSENLFWETPDLVPKIEHIGLYAIMVFCGICWTLASWVFGRAVENDPPRPLLAEIFCCATDELLSTWLMFVGVAPGIFIFAIYTYHNPENLEFKLAFVASLICTLLTLVFVYFFLPREHKTPYRNLISPFITCLCVGCPSFWMKKHVQNDLLVLCWMSCWGCLICCLGTFTLTIRSIVQTSMKDIYDYGTFFFDCVIFLIGCMYFTAASYPSGGGLASEGERGSVGAGAHRGKSASFNSKGPLVAIPAESRPSGAALEV